MSSRGDLKTRPRSSIISVQRGTHVCQALTNDPRRVDTGNPYPHPRGAFGRRRETLHVERRPHSPPSGPNRRFPPERAPNHTDSPSLHPVPSRIRLADITTPFPGNASAKFQKNLNRLPTGGDRIPAPRLLSISRQLESRAERGCSNRRSRAGSPVQRSTGRRNPPRPAENRSGGREAAQPFGTGPLSACRFAADIRIRPQR